MPVTALDLSPDALKAYRPLDFIRRRDAASSAELTRRRRRALYAARKAARILKDEFGASAVLVFGSMAHPGHFTRWSDIDLAAVGIPPERFYAAVAAVTGLSAEFKTDLLDLPSCPESLRKTIEDEGRKL